MKQLSGLDSTFLYMETPTTFGHVTGLMKFGRPSGTMSHSRPSMLGTPLSRRARIDVVPFGLDHPYWWLTH